jgi:hypothetical protein
MKIIITILFLFIQTLTFSQEVYKRNLEENAEHFLARVFPQTEFSQVISGKWGDTTYSNKIIGFYLDSIEWGKKVLILQAMPGNSYTRLKCDYLIGASTSSITSVFFYDTDKNGTREMVILLAGIKRCFDEEDESISGACDFCEYLILEQKNKSVTIGLLEHNEDFPGNCDAKSVKEFLKNKKTKK